jgi:hypothetical protein
MEGGGGTGPESGDWMSFPCTSVREEEQHEEAVETTWRGLVWLTQIREREEKQSDGGRLKSYGEVWFWLTQIRK